MQVQKQMKNAAVMLESIDDVEQASLGLSWSRQPWDCR